VIPRQTVRGAQVDFILALDGAVLLPQPAAEGRSLSGLAALAPAGHGLRWAEDAGRAARQRLVPTARP